MLPFGYSLFEGGWREIRVEVLDVDDVSRDRFGPVGLRFGGRFEVRVEGVSAHGNVYSFSQFVSEDFAQDGAGWGEKEKEANGIG